MRRIKATPPPAPPPPPEPVTVRRLTPAATWIAALDRAGRDVTRMRVLDDGSILVVNTPAAPTPPPRRRRYVGGR
jgi:hypothetical protein